MAPTCRAIVFLMMSTLLLSHSSSASIGATMELLSKAPSVQISPDDTWSCCSGSRPCEHTSSSEPPSCAFDGDSSTRLTFAPGQRKATITVDLNPGAIIDHFDVSFDASSIIPSSVTVTLVGNDVTWTTYNNKSCQPTDRHLRKQGSLYYSCTRAGQFWNASVPEGVFSVRNGSFGWLWWRSFSQLQLTIEANNDDYDDHENSSIVIADIRLYGWNVPTSGCNCHPVGVANATAPCDSNGICRCRLGYTPGQCVPIFSDQQMIEAYGPKSGGTGFSLTLINNTQNITNVTIGNDYECLLTIVNDSAIHLQTTGAQDSDLQSALPIWICWERTRDAVSCLATNVEFTYKPDPVVYSIYPRRSIVSGGITQTVIGANLDLVVFPYITVYSVLESTKQDQVIEYNYKKGVYQNHPEDRICKTVNSTMLECQAMPFEAIIGSDHSLYIGISLDIIQLYNDYQHCRLDKCDFALVNDPDIDSWPNDLMTLPVYDGRKTVMITGQRFQLDLGVDEILSLHVYSVTVSDISCTIDGLVNNGITFSPPDISLLTDNTKKQPTVIYIGAYYSYTVGNLVYYKNWIDDPKHRNGLIGGLVGGIGGAILIAGVIVLIVFLCRRSQKKATLLDYEARYTRPPGEHDGPVTEYLSDDVKAQVIKYTVPYERIELVHELGHGNFGKVFKGTLTDKAGVKQPVAIKSLHGAHHDIKDKVEFVEEAILMADFCHKHVLSLIAIVIEENVPYVVLPLMELGDLRTYISKDGNSFNVGNLVKFCLEVAEGMEYLASRRFVHRDLAARNCMINKDMLVKVADFGLARDIFEKDYYRAKDTQRPLPVKWMAIECLSSNTEFTEKSDVWAYGVLVWELMTRGKRPYSDVDNLDLKRFLLQGRRLEKPPVAPDFIYDLMLRCWLPDRKDRPRFKDIVVELKEILTAAEENSTPTHAPAGEMNGAFDNERVSYLQLSGNQRQ